MGSLQRSRLSPPFPFALRRWSPCPRHFLNLKRVGWVSGSPSIPMRTDLPEKATVATHSPNSHSRYVLCVRCRSWCPEDPNPASRERGVLKGQRCPRGNEGTAVPRWRGWGTPFLSHPSWLRSPPALTRTGRAARWPLQHLSAPSTAPLGSAHSQCLARRKKACARCGATSPRKPLVANDWPGAHGEEPALHRPSNQFRWPHVRQSGWPIPPKLCLLMPAPRPQVHPIRKGIVHWLRLEGLAESVQVRGAVTLWGPRERGGPRGALPSVLRQFSAGCFLRGCPGGWVWGVCVNSAALSTTYRRFGVHQPCPAEWQFSHLKPFLLPPKLTPRPHCLVPWGKKKKRKNSAQWRLHQSA